MIYRRIILSVMPTVFIVRVSNLTTTKQLLVSSLDKYIPNVVFVRVYNLTTAK